MLLIDEAHTPPRSKENQEKETYITTAKIGYRQILLIILGWQRLIHF